MELKVTRRVFQQRSTIGDLYANGSFVCNTLEDVVREGEKVYGQTAIPEGRYEVIIDFSARFQKDMPHVLDVPGFEGIRIHSGNTDKDTSGCILVGTWDGKAEDLITQSRAYFELLMDILERAVGRKEQIWLTVTHEE